jgi:conjugal transfer ATP-binding protein TraC
MTIIKTAVRHVWDREGNQGEIDLVKRALVEFDTCLKHQDIDLPYGSTKIKEIAAELAFNLSDFTGNGPYARWFKGKSTLDIERDRFVTLELEELLVAEELFNVVILQMVNYVCQNLYLSDRSTPRIIVFDEAWKWFKEGSFLGEVVENGYRLARRYFGGFITIFQSMMDLRKFGKSGLVLNENSAYKFYLWAKKKYDLAVQEKYIDADPFMLEMLNSVWTEAGRYSEIMIETPSNMGVARLPGDPFSHLLFTSNPEENTAINAYARTNGLTEIEAIKDLVIKTEHSTTNGKPQLEAIKAMLGLAA